jgi:hypothetical protein
VDGGIGAERIGVAVALCWSKRSGGLRRGPVEHLRRLRRRSGSSEGADKALRGAGTCSQAVWLRDARGECRPSACVLYRFLKVAPVALAAISFFEEAHLRSGVAPRALGRSFSASA